MLAVRTLPLRATEPLVISPTAFDPKLNPVTCTCLGDSQVYYVEHVIQGYSHVYSDLSLGCGPQEQFYGCADIAVGYSDVVVGESSEPVSVPQGDTDVRKWDEMPEQCACTCPQTSGGNTYRGTFLHMFLLAVVVPVASRCS